MNAPEIASGSGSCFSVGAEDGANAFLEHQRGAEREQQAVERIAAVGAAQRELEQHAEHADDHRRQQQRNRIAPAERQRAVAGEQRSPRSPLGATITQRDVHAEREERPVREVDRLHQAHDQHEAERDQREQQPERERR